MLQRILTADEDTGVSRYDVSSLRVMASGAAALRPDLATALMDSFGAILYNQYGATESGWATIARPADLRAEPGAVGRPVPGLTVAILDTDGRPVAGAQVGEVFIGGGMPFDGYTGGGGQQLRDGLMSTPARSVGSTLPRTQAGVATGRPALVAHPASRRS
jgi:acyl-coenzyme A synthetase/AMP-(fatty) acid ligase